MLDETKVLRSLEPFGLSLTSKQLNQVLIYLETLLRWNRRINLTAIRTAEGCLSRHFGESLYLARWIKLNGRLLDIGSGAGFPGLALKIAFPNLSVTLLEPTSKKRAFLKEVARLCGMESVEVRPERLEDFVREPAEGLFEAATMRAVGPLERLVGHAAECLERGGRLFLWVSRDQAIDLADAHRFMDWTESIAMPPGRNQEILVGTRRGV